MLGFFFRSRQPHQPKTPRRTRLAVEALESRYCPANSLSLSLAATPVQGNTVVLHGQEVANGVDPTTTTITFSGVVSGTVTPDDNGHFCYTTTASALGEVDAVATDEVGDTSNQAAAQLDNWAGWGLTLTAAVQTGTMVQLSGQVTTSSDPTQTQITIGGVMGALTAPTTSNDSNQTQIPSGVCIIIKPNADGSFTYTGPASQLGTVSAMLADSGGNVQAIAQTTVQCPAPVITNLAASLGSGTTVTLTGNVVAQSPGGLVVNFAGALGATVTTNPDGSFSLTTTAARLGTVMAQVVDVWNQLSPTATVVLTSPPPSIQSFGGANNAPSTWVLSGQMNSGYVAGWTVTITGVPGYQPINTTVLDDGSFWDSVIFPNQTNVVVTVTVTDQWGQQATAVDVLC